MYTISTCILKEYLCTNLQNSAVALARDCVYGPETMPISTRSGCGQNVQQLDPDKLNYIKNIIAGRIGKNPKDAEYELGKVLHLHWQACQILHTKAKKM